MTHQFSSTRCSKPSTKIGGGGYGTGVWCVCDEHTAAVDENSGYFVDWRPMKPDEAALQTAVGIAESRNIYAWDPEVYKHHPSTVDHPPHYKANGIEAIDVIEAFGLGFNTGNCVKYLLRAGRKGDALEDLKKAAWYLQREIARTEKP